MRYQKIQMNKGYTLIETMISVSLFLVIVVSGLGALLNANALHLKSEDSRSIMDSLSFVLEDMSRNLRTGYNYQCFIAGASLSPGTLGAPRSCASGWAVAFEFAEGNRSSLADQGVYYVSGGKVFKSTNGASSFIQLTQDEVVVNTASFSVLGAEAYPGNLQQPFIIIRLSGVMTSKNITTPFLLQTSVSERLVDI